jgi:hypothetical protein
MKENIKDKVEEEFKFSPLIKTIKLIEAEAIAFMIKKGIVGEEKRKL